MKFLAELLWLLRQFVTDYRKRKADDEIEQIKNDPVGSWAERFGRVRSSGEDSECSGRCRAGDATSELPADHPGTARSE